jgi:hypothetical protein
MRYRYNPADDSSRSGVWRKFERAVAGLAAIFALRASNIRKRANDQPASRILDDRIATLHPAVRGEEKLCGKSPCGVLLGQWTRAGERRMPTTARILTALALLCVTSSAHAQGTTQSGIGSGSIGSGSMGSGSIGRGSVGSPSNTTNTSGPSTVYSNTQYGTPIFQNPIGIGQSRPVGATPAYSAQQQRDLGIGGQR